MDRALEERNKLKISVVRPGELGPGEIAVWLSMQRQTPALANPFLCPDFTVAVGALRPSARVAVLHDGPHLAGFFPFERRGLGGGVPIGHGLNQCQGLIHAPGAEWEKFAGLDGAAARRLATLVESLPKKLRLPRKPAHAPALAMPALAPPAADRASTLTLDPLMSPAGVNSVEPQFTVQGDRAILSWLGYTDDEIDQLSGPSA